MRNFYLLYFGTSPLRRKGKLFCGCAVSPRCHNLMLCCGGEAVSSLCEDLHQVVTQISANFQVSGESFLWAPDTLSMSIFCTRPSGLHRIPTWYINVSNVLSLFCAPVPQVEWKKSFILASDSQITHHKCAKTSRLQK